MQRRRREGWREGKGVRVGGEEEAGMERRGGQGREGPCDDDSRELRPVLLCCVIYGVVQVVARSCAASGCSCIRGGVQQ